jgi:hypothetical protein
MGLGPAFAQVRCDLRAKMVRPAPNSFVGDHDTAFCKQIIDVAKAQGKPDIELDRLLDDFRREAVSGVADFAHRGE